MSDRGSQYGIVELFPSAASKASSMEIQNQAIPPQTTDPQQPPTAISPTMFEEAISTLASILENNPWVPEIAGILPLSALIDFVDVPLKLHVHQLVSGVPLWSWPVTPAGSRLLLSKSVPQEGPCLDRFGRSASLEALDGRYGDRYFLSSPETLRLALKSQQAVTVENDHDNMRSDNDLRVQHLEVVFVSRVGAGDNRDAFEARWYHYALGHPAIHSIGFIATSALGWVALLGCIIAAILFRLYIALAFLLLMPLTGILIFGIYGGRPRRLLVSRPSEYNRMVVVTEHMNSTEWTVFYGESTIVNSLLNRPLEPTQPDEASPARLRALQSILRLFILGQWAAAIGAATTKNWNSFFISFWVIFCNATHGFFIPPTGRTGDWAVRCAKVQLQRYKTKLSSRRALLNALVALNPDTFAETPGGGTDRTKLYAQGMTWMDPILKPSANRTAWEAATMDALNEVDAWGGDDEEVAAKCRNSEPSPFGAQWSDRYQGRDTYWKPFISEGIYVTSKVRFVGSLPRRKVPRDEKASC